MGLISLFFQLLRLAAWLFEIALLIYVVLSFVKPAQSAATQWLNRIVEPVLVPLRRLLAKYLPEQWRQVDWSPVAALILVWLVEKFLWWLT